VVLPAIGVVAVVAPQQVELASLLEVAPSMKLLLSADGVDLELHLTISLPHRDPPHELNLLFISSCTSSALMNTAPHPLALERDDPSCHMLPGPPLMCLMSDGDALPPHAEHLHDQFSMMSTAFSMITPSPMAERSLP
jgi:hypothetical protein